MAFQAQHSAPERGVLEEEFKWLLREGVPAALAQLQGILQEAAERVTPSQGAPFRLGTAEGVRAQLTLQGGAVCQADLSLKVPRASQTLHFALRDDAPWHLQQVQDCRNHVTLALQHLARRAQGPPCRSGPEVLKLMDAVMLQLSRARNRLACPAAPTLPEMASGRLMERFSPPLPREVLVNICIQLHKLTLVVYQLHALQPGSAKASRQAAGGATLHPPGATFEAAGQRFEVTQAHKAECPVPWLKDALLFLTVALQLCQQMKEKVALFAGYWN